MGSKPHARCSVLCTVYEHHHCMWSAEQTNEIPEVGRAANITLFYRSVIKDVH